MAKKTKRSSAFDVVARVPGLKVGHSDLCFDVKRGSKKIGTFQLSKGNIEFIPTNAMPHADGKYDGRRINWEKLADYMLDELNEVKITKKK